MTPPTAPPSTPRPHPARRGVITASGEFVPLYATLGERIRYRREAARLLPIDLARKAGVSKAYLSELESNQKINPSADVLYRLAEVLGTTIPDLLGRSEQWLMSHMVARRAGKEGGAR